MLSEDAVLGFEYGYSLAEPNALTLGKRSSATSPTARRCVRPVHLFGRAQVAAHVRPRLPPAARLRRPGSGAFLRPARAFPPALRRRQYAGRQLHDAGQLLPRLAPAAASQVPQAADPDDAEVAAAPQALRLAARGDSPGAPASTLLWVDAQIRAERDDQAERGRQNPPRRPLLRQGLLRPAQEREKRGIKDVSLVRVEQLYPFPPKSLVQSWPASRTPRMVWCQEEPQNMGAWTFVEPYLAGCCSRKPASKAKEPRYAGRPASAATATA